MSMRRRVAKHNQTSASSALARRHFSLDHWAHRSSIRIASVPSKGLTEAWLAAETARPREWDVMGVVRGPREANPKINGHDWVAWAKGPHAGERVQGEGGSPQEALLDLANRLRTLA